MEKPERSVDGKHEDAGLAGAGAMATAPVKTAAPRRLDARTYRDLRRLLTGAKPFSAPGLGRRLDTIASIYRQRLLDPPRSRKEDRGAFQALAVELEAVAAALDLLDDGAVASLRGVPPVPWVVDRQAWLADLARRLRTLNLTELGRGMAEDDHCPLGVSLRAVATKLVLLDEVANRHPLFFLRAGPDAWPVEDWSDHLPDAVRVVAAACRVTRECWKTFKGPEPRSPIMLLAEDLYCVVREARGRPLVLRLHDRNRQYLGQPVNDDSRFLLAFTEHVHGTAPKAVRRDHPQRFVATAIFDAYKELTEEVSKGYDPCAPRHGSSRVR